MNNKLLEWAAKWRLPAGALTDLYEQLGALSEAPAVLDGHSEAAVQSQVRLEASRKGGRLWRNNVGALLDDRGVPIRFGLANDSAKVNELLKSSDLIGPMPKLITPADVGKTVGLFTARECKPADWKYSGTDREVAQLAFITLVNLLGGDAQFVTRGGTL